MIATIYLYGGSQDGTTTHVLCNGDALPEAWNGGRYINSGFRVRIPCGNRNEILDLPVYCAPGTIGAISKIIEKGKRP